MVTWTGTGEFPIVIGFVDTSDCYLAAGLDPYAVGDPEVEVSCSRIAGPGEYWLFVSHQEYTGYPCGANNNYVAAVTCVTLDEGACCDPATQECNGPVDQPTCDAMYGGTGVWHPGITCDPNPCPPPAGPGDACDNPLYVNLPGDLPYTSANNYTCGRGDNYPSDDMCYYFGDGEDGVYELDVASAIDVDFTFDPKGTTWSYFEITNACPPNGTCLGYAGSSSGSVASLTYVHLDPGTYWIIVDTWPTPDCIPDFDLSITASPTANEGDNCTDPLDFTFGSADLPYTIADQYTCGRGNNYSNTCLGSYDGGEDIIMAITPTDDMNVDITLDPKGTTYTGLAIDAACPLDASTCLGKVTISGSDPGTIYNVSLTGGVTYYLMADTWPTPDCIPDFDVTFTAAAAGPENDNCADATPIGDVTDLAFTTVPATFDGPGGCQTAPNLWYCYTASCTGLATISLCGSSYDTKMAVYDGCSCTGAQLACNDDFCSVQSEVTIDVVAGQQYLIEVGGYSSNVGAGVLTTSCVVPVPPDNDYCEDAVVHTCPADINGDNSFATNENPTCFDDCGHAWEAFTIDEASDVTIDYCGTSPAFELVYISLYTDCPCTVAGDYILADDTDWDLCGDGNVTMHFYGLDAGTYYLPILSCYEGYESDYKEGPYHININCAEPSYCPGSGGCDEYVENVTFNDIDNTSGCDGYGDYTSIVTEVAPGATYGISMSIGNAYSSDAGAIWIDFDHSLSFDADEVVLTGSGGGPYSGTVTIPTDAAFGETRMRVRLVYNLDPTEYPCGTTSYGEVEDYTVNIVCTPSDLPVGMTPDPIYMYYAFAIDPFEVNVYVAPDNAGGPTADQIDVNTVTVNGLTPISCTLGGPVLNFSCGPTVTATFALPDFIASYGTPVGTFTKLCNVSGQLLDTSPFFYTGVFTLNGKDPADPSKWMVPAGEVVVRADCDRNGFVNISDATFLISFIFGGGPAPYPYGIADCDCSASVNISDAVYLIGYIFGSGAAPCSVPR
jgi:hypothetical protein